MSRFSATLLDHFHEPRNRGRMERPDCVGSAGSPGSGPSIVLYLRADGNRVADARFEAFGCGVTIASGSMLTMLVTGLQFADCEKITAGDLVAALSGVPVDKSYCPALAVAALRKALIARRATRPEVTSGHEAVGEL